MKTILSLVLILASAATYAELQPISNEEMSAEVGQATGIIASFDFRLNADKTGTVLPLCTDASTRTECRIAISLAHRGTDNVDKNWLVFKGISGRIYVPKMTLDAGTVNYSGTDVAAMVFGFGGSANPIQINNWVIDNIGVELDDTTSPGYMKDTGSSAAATAAYGTANVNSGFMGLQISGPSNTANVAINGTLKVYSCPPAIISCS